MFLKPGDPLPPDRIIEPESECITRAAIELLETLMDHYPEQRDSIERGANIRITTADGVDHLLRLACK